MALDPLSVEAQPSTVPVMRISTRRNLCPLMLNTVSSETIWHCSTPTALPMTCLVGAANSSQETASLNFAGTCFSCAMPYPLKTSATDKIIGTHVTSYFLHLLSGQSYSFHPEVVTKIWVDYS